MGTGTAVELMGWLSGVPGGVPCPPFVIPAGEGTGWCSGKVGWTCSCTPPRPSPSGASATTINTSSCSGCDRGCRQNQQESDSLSQPLFSQQKETGWGKARLDPGLLICGLRGRARTAEGSQPRTLGQLCISLQPQLRLPVPPSPHPPAPAPLPFATFALFTNMSPEFKWVIYSVAASLSHRGPVPAWRRVRPKQREKKRKEQKNSFQLFLFLSPHTPPQSLAPTLFYFVCVRVCRALSSLAVPPSSPLSSPWPCFSPLYVTR